MRSLFGCDLPMSGRICRWRYFNYAKSCSINVNVNFCLTPTMTMWVTTLLFGTAICTTVLHMCEHTYLTKPTRTVELYKTIVYATCSSKMYVCVCADAYTFLL